jgi:hypothetical protein
MHLAWTDGSSHAHWPWKSPPRLALRALTRGCSPSTLTSCIHLPVPLCSTPITALLSSYGDSDSSAGLLPDRGLPASRHTSFETILPPITQRPPSSLSHATPQLDGSPLTGSRLHLWLAGSPGSSGRIKFVSLRTGLSPPVALHPASRRRSYLRFPGRRAYAWRGLSPLYVCARGRTSPVL